MKLEPEKTLSWIGAGSLSPSMETQALDVFDTLTPGRQMTVFSDAPLEHLHQALLRLRPGRFEWTPLPEDRGLFGVQIFRRAAEPGAGRGVNEALSWDHDRLDALEAAVFESRHERRLGDAAALFRLFAFGLRRHIRFEEEILFPEFELKAGFPSQMGPTAVMRLEHREILDTVTALEGAVGRDDAEAERLRRILHAVLGPHNAKEEAVVYPLTDRALDDTARDALVARIQAAA